MDAATKTVKIILNPKLSLVGKITQAANILKDEAPELMKSINTKRGGSSKKNYTAPCAELVRFDKTKAGNIRVWYEVGVKTVD